MRSVCLSEDYFYSGWDRGVEWAASVIEAFKPDDIRLACGELTAQEMRTVLAVRDWWAASLRRGRE